MKVKVLFVLALNIIGLSSAYMTEPYDGCTWGLANTSLSLEPGSVITDAILTIENIRPTGSCLNPTLHIQLLNNPAQGFHIYNQPQSIQALFPSGPTPALVAHWKLNELSATIASDSSGNQNQGILIYNPLWIEGQGLSFETNQFMGIPSSPSLSISTPMAISLWFKMRTAAPYAKLLIKPYVTRSDPWELFALDLGSDGCTPRFLISDGIPGGQYAAAFNQDYKIIPDRWYHIAAAYDGSQMRLFMDGQQIAQSPAALQIGSNTMPLCIGGRLGADTFDGIIHTVQLYSGPSNDPPVQFVQSRNLFENSGTPLRKIGLADLGTASSIRVSLQQIENTDSWARAVYGDSFTMPLPGQTSALPLSSSLLGLLDYAGTGSSFGFGMDSDGFVFDRITLEITMQSYLAPEEKQTRVFSCQNRYAPYIFSLSELSGQPHQLITFPVYVIDPDQNPYTLTAKNLPPGAVFSNRFFSWTPTEQQQGLWTVLLEASDGVMTAQRQVEILVTEPTPIFAPLGNSALFELQNLTFAVEAADLAGNPVSITASGLPENATFDGSTFTWRPLVGQAGIYEITFTASNEIRQEEMKITITVYPYRPSSPKPILIL